MSVSDRLSDRVACAGAFAQVASGELAATANDSPSAPLVPAARLTARHLARLDAVLTDRERAVLRTLAVVKAASGRQLQRLHFAGVPSAERQCRRLLARLVEHRLLARLGRSVGGVRAGSAGWVYALDAAGQRLAAPAQSRWRRPYTPGPLFLRHRLAVTEVYVAVVEAERRGEVEVLRFATEPECWRSAGGVVVKPDACTRLLLPNFEDVWFIEVDCGSEAPVTLARKLAAYRRYWQSGIEQERHGVFPAVVWLVPDAARYQVVVDVIARQPADSWPLYRVALLSDATAVLTGRPR
jgi:protein involved in plasmid replication-relaxation